MSTTLARRIRRIDVQKEPAKIPVTDVTGVITGEEVQVMRLVVHSAETHAAAERAIRATYRVRNLAFREGRRRAKAGLAQNRLKGMNNVRCI